MLASLGVGGEAYFPNITNSTSQRFHISTRYDSSILFCSSSNSTICSCGNITMICLDPTTHCFAPQQVLCLENNKTNIDEEIAGIVGIANIQANEVTEHILSLCWHPQCNQETTFPHAPWFAFQSHFVLDEANSVLFRFENEHAVAGVRSQLPIRVDTSTEYTWIDSVMFSRLQVALNTYCDDDDDVAMHCPGMRNFADPAALACFKFDSPAMDIPQLPALQFILAGHYDFTVYPADYMFETAGSHCIGIFQQDPIAGAKEIVIGMNLLIGKRMVINFSSHMFQLITSNASYAAVHGENEFHIVVPDPPSVGTVSAPVQVVMGRLPLVSNWLVFFLWGMACVWLGFMFGKWFAFKWRILPCYRRQATQRKRKMPPRKVTFIFDNGVEKKDDDVVKPNDDDNSRTGEEEEEELIV